MHGSNPLVVPVRRDNEPLALRMTPPSDNIADEVAALTFWAGRGTVQLIDTDLAAGGYTNKETRPRRDDRYRRKAALPDGR